MSVPGHLIADRYRLVTQVGTGGMGVVWEGWDERLQRRVAVKQLRLPPELTDDERDLASQRAMREARITARLHHRYAVSVFDVVDDDGRPSLIMQFLPSRTLSEVLAERGTLPPQQVARLGAEVASALSAAHELGIVHRDVKPGNVLIADDGTAHISDFGISRALDDITMTTTGMVHGTPAYLSPEVARGEQATFASDLFGLGATMYAALEGSPPFGTDSNSIALLHRVASGDFEPPRHGGPLTPLLLQLLSSDPAARPPMDAAASMLAELASHPVDAETAAVGADSETAELTTPTATPAAAAAVATPIEATAETVASAVQAPAVPAETARETEPDDGQTDELTTPIAATAAAAAVVTPEEPQTTDVPPPDTDGETAHTDDGQTDQTTTPAETAAAAGVGTQIQPTAGMAAAQPPPTDGGNAPPRRPWRRRRTALVAVLVAALAAVGIGTAFLLRLLGGPAPGTVAQPPATSTSSPSGASTGSRPRSSTAKAQPTTPAPDRSPSPSPRTSPTPTPSPTPPPSPKGDNGSGTKAVTDVQLRDAITSYYAQMPGNTDRAWTLMTDSYKASHMHGRQGFEQFWSAIDRVDTQDVTATAPDHADATLIYHFKDGRVVVERTRYQLVDEGGTLKIADSSVLSSSTH